MIKVILLKSIKNYTRGNCDEKIFYFDVRDFDNVLNLLFCNDIFSACENW